MSEDALERCARELGSREACELAYRVSRLVDGMRLEECIERHGIDRCLEACVRECRHGDCERLCDHAVGNAAAAVVAREVLKEAVQAALRRKADLLGAIAASFVEMLLKFVQNAGDCHKRVRLVYLLGGVVMELVELVGAGEPVLLLAPVLAAVRGCADDQIDGVLEALRPAVGSDYVARIAAALEEGAVKIGSTVIRFPPLAGEKI